MHSAPPRVIDTITVGQTPEGLKMSDDGRFIAVTVMNGSNKPKGSPFRSDHGLLSILKIDQGELKRVASAPIGHWCQGAVWSHDGTKILAECMVEREIEVFSFDGTALKRKGSIRTGGPPAALATAR